MQSILSQIGMGMTITSATFIIIVAWIMIFSDETKYGNSILAAILFLVGIVIIILVSLVVSICIGISKEACLIVVSHIATSLMVLAILKKIEKKERLS